MSTHPSTHPTKASPLGLRSLLHRHPLVAYFILAYGLMWLFAVPMAVSRNAGAGLLPYDLPAGLDNLLFLLATFSGPTVAALIVTGLTEGRGGVGRLLKRIVQWRTRPHWYLVALGINLLIWLLSYSVLMGPTVLVAAVSRWQLLATTFLPLVAFGIIFPSIAEEPGWRGFALPRLQQRYGPLGASMILGVLHGLWHLPALMTINFGPLPRANYVPFVLTAMLATVLYTWVYNATNGSVLMAILMHAASNAVSGWLTTLFQTAGLHEPSAGVAGWLAATGWSNVLAYGGASLLVVGLTHGRLSADGGAHLNHRSEPAADGRDRWASAASPEPHAGAHR